MPRPHCLARLGTTPPAGPTVRHRRAPEIGRLGVDWGQFAPGVPPLPWGSEEERPAPRWEGEGAEGDGVTTGLLRSEAGVVRGLPRRKGSE